MSKNFLTVGITGMNARPDNPGPGYAVARCLRAAPDFHGRIIALSYDALYSADVCDAAYLLPYPSAGDVSLLEHFADGTGQKVRVIYEQVLERIPRHLEAVQYLQKSGR